jgi:hypothetical protein
MGAKDLKTRWLGEQSLPRSELCGVLPRNNPMVQYLTVTIQQPEMMMSDMGSIGEVPLVAQADTQRAAVYLWKRVA